MDARFLGLFVVSWRLWSVCDCTVDREGREGLDWLEGVFSLDCDGEMWKRWIRRVDEVECWNATRTDRRHLKPHAMCTLADL